jgi:hypothetical protein
MAAKVRVFARHFSYRLCNREKNGPGKRCDMGLISDLAKSAVAALLVSAPIGDTTVLLLLSVSLECLLMLMLLRERSRSRAAKQSNRAPAEIPFSALWRTAPHLRARRPALRTAS